MTADILRGNVLKNLAQATVEWPLLYSGHVAAYAYHSFIYLYYLNIYLFIRVKVNIFNINI